MMAFFISSAQVGRAIVAPPGVPAERVATLRAAFDAMLKDPDLLAEIDKSGLEFVPASGDAVQKVIRDTIAAPREIVEKTQAIVRK
jgi:tripartite-type tricarboxylate transporter receptor subunit TctC